MPKRGPYLARSADSGTLFLNRNRRPLRPNRLSERLHRYFAAAELGKSRSCHVWRHTAATLMHESGADIRGIQEMLGHAQLSTTQVYTRVSIRRLKEVHTSTHPARLLRDASSAQGGEGVD